MTARLSPTRTGWKFVGPCVNHPSKEVCFTLTVQQSATGQFPEKTCAACRHRYPVIAFIKRGQIEDDGYYYVADSDRCHFCEPPQPIRLHHGADGRLRMRLQLHRENGEVVGAFDPSTGSFAPLGTIGLRRMTPTGNHLRLQPRSDRSHDITGKAYC